MTKEELIKDFGGIVKTYSKPHDRQFYCNDYVHYLENKLETINYNNYSLLLPDKKEIFKQADKQAKYTNHNNKNLSKYVGFQNCIKWLESLGYKTK